MCEELKLSALPEGESGFVTEIEAPGAMLARLADLGLVPGTRVTCLLASPAGDPRAYLIRGALIALRRRDAAGIAVSRRGPGAPEKGAAR